MEIQEEKPGVPSSAESGINWWIVGAQVIVIVVFLGCIALIILALLGPAIGNVFSNIYAGI